MNEKERRLAETEEALKCDSQAGSYVIENLYIESKNLNIHWLITELKVSWKREKEQDLAYERLLNNFHGERSSFIESNQKILDLIKENEIMKKALEQYRNIPIYCHPPENSQVTKYAAAEALAKVEEME